MKVGSHWEQKRALEVLGDIYRKRGAYVVGGYACTLLHRHDIRVGIASGMYLRLYMPEAVNRIELLAALYPCYWRWSTSCVLRYVQPHMEELLSADSHRRADILQAAYDAMVAELQPFHVVGDRAQRRVDLFLRSEARSRRQVNCFGYHPFQNPASRRTGDVEFRVLAENLRDGSLWRACEDLIKVWNIKPSYKESVQVLAEHNIRLWSGRNATYGRTRWET